MRSVSEILVPRADVQKGRSIVTRSVHDFTLSSENFSFMTLAVSNLRSNPLAIIRSNTVLGNGPELSIVQS